MKPNFMSVEKQQQQINHLNEDGITYTMIENIFI